MADALNALFYGKCAYCESSIKAVQPTDIEHYRPKGRVAGCPEHPGYWWLAASWHNLLPACIDCNRSRYQTAHQLAYDQMENEVNGQFLLGKGELFPILGARYALAEADDHEAEDAALIDPTRRDPKAHLKWLQQSELSLVGPRVHNGVLDPYGRHTYTVVGLNRQGLVEERTARMRDIKVNIALIEQLLDSSLDIPEPGSTNIRRIAFNNLLSLHERYARPHHPYSAMAEELLDEEVSRLMEKYKRLLADLVA